MTATVNVRNFRHRHYQVLQFESLYLVKFIIKYEGSVTLYWARLFLK